MEGSLLEGEARAIEQAQEAARAAALEDAKAKEAEAAVSNTVQEASAKAEEVTANNCESAFYRFTFQLPSQFTDPVLSGSANVDDMGVLYLNGKWVKAAATFNIELCEKFDVLPTEFDGTENALFQEFDAVDVL